MKKIVIISVIIFLVSTIMYFVFSIYGNPLEFAKAKPRIEEHKNSLKDVIFDDFNESKISYDFKMNSYYRKYTYKTQPLLSFNISCYKSGCNDTYDFDYVEGTNALAILGNRIRDSKFSDFNTKYPDYGYLLLEPIKSLNELGENKDKFLNNEDIESLPIFKATIMLIETDFNDPYVYEHIMDVSNYMTSKDYYPEYIEVTLFLEDEETYKVVDNITKDILSSKTLFYEHINKFETKNGSK